MSVVGQLRRIQRQLTTVVFQSLIIALVLSRHDYCNIMLVGLSANVIQNAQNDVTITSH